MDNGVDLNAGNLPSSSARRRLRLKKGLDPDSKYEDLTNKFMLLSQRLEFMERSMFNQAYAFVPPTLAGQPDAETPPEMVC